MANEFMTANSYFGLALEATRGVAGTVSTFTPIGDPKVEPKLTWLDDTSFRGSPVMQYDQVPGVRHDEFSGKTYMYNDIYPQLLRAVLGGVDTVASVGPSLWTHSIGLYNAANLGSQPPSYTIINDSVDNTYQMLGSQCDNLSISFGADAAVETTFMFIGNPATTTASVAVSESVQHLVPGWNVSASVGGVAVTVIESGTLDIKRSTAPIHTIGQQAPLVNFAGPLEASGKLTFVVQAGQSYWANGLARDEQQILLQFVDPATSNYSLFQMSAAQIEQPVISTGKNYISLDVDFVAVSNTTDAITGYSPITTVSRNAISTQY